MKKFRKIIALGLAATAAVSAMSMTAFAQEDEIFATIEDNNGNITYVYDSDLVNGEYTTVAGDEVVTFGEREDNGIMPLTINGTFNRKSIPISPLELRESVELEYELPKSTPARYSPNTYYSSSGTIDFAFNVYSDSARKATGHVKTSGNLYSLDLTGTKVHYVTVSGCNSTSKTAYAYVMNSTANTDTATGYCLIRPMYN